MNKQFICPTCGYSFIDDDERAKIVCQSCGNEIPNIKTEDYNSAYDNTNQDDAFNRVSLDDLTNELINAFSFGDYANAEKIAYRITDICPESSIGWFGFARAISKDFTDAKYYKTVFENLDMALKKATEQEYFSIKKAYDEFSKINISNSSINNLKSNQLNNGVKGVLFTIGISLLIIFIGVGIFSSPIAIGGGIIFFVSLFLALPIVILIFSNKGRYNPRNYRNYNLNHYHYRSTHHSRMHHSHHNIHHSRHHGGHHH